MRQTKTDRSFRILSRIFIILLCILIGFPLIMTLSVSLQTMNDIYSPDLNLVPKVLQFHNYADAMHNGDWPVYFKNSIIVAILSTGISLGINAMAGFVFARIPFKGREPLFILILVGMMIPTQVTLVPVFLLVRSVPLAGGNNIWGQGGTGLMNTYAGLVLPYLAGSFGVFLCRQFYIGFPNELDDAARIDGCSRLGQFLRVYLPLSGPVLASVGILKFTDIWNEYTWPLVMTTKQSMKTVQLALATFRDEGETYWNLLMAATLICGIPIYILFFFTQKYFVKGLLAGSVKG